MGAGGGLEPGRRLPEVLLRIVNKFSHKGRFSGEGRSNSKASGKPKQRESNFFSIQMFAIALENISADSRNYYANRRVKLPRLLLVFLALERKS